MDKATEEKLRQFEGMKKKIPDFIKDDEPIRKPVAKLAKLLTNNPKKHLGLQPITKEDYEYWGLAAIATDEEAELACKMGVRIPKTFEQLKSLSGKSDEELKKMLDHMSWTGLLEYNCENLDGKNPDHEKRWNLPVLIPGVGEFTNMNHTLLREHPEMGSFFDQMARTALGPISHMVPEGGGGIGMHVIPVEKAIDMENESISVEHISYWLDKYEGKYAASPCSCRLSRSTYDDNCGDDPENWCIALGDLADYVVEQDKGGTYVTKEEALRIIEKAEKNGFVHQITNIDGEHKIFAICNCNSNVCYGLRSSQMFNTPNLSRSAYVARVDKEKCVACGRCVEKCPAGAVKLGQKLCKEDGTEVKYPMRSLPSLEKWGKDKWDYDYRNTIRVNCYDTGTSPCKTACPAHIAVQGYLKLAAQGKYTEALELIKRENPFPAVCGRVCNRRCEDACTRGTIDEAVAIDEVKRFIAQRDLDAETRFIPEKIVPKVYGEFDEKVAIIGGGPAGLSCAYYLAIKGYKPVVFEKESRVGGMMMNGIPNFRLEKDVVQAEIDILKELGVEFRCGIEVGTDVTIPELKEQGFKAFYLAIGLQSGGKLGIPGDDAEGVQAGIDFIRKVNLNGTGTLKGKVVVIGGGNIGCDVARAAVRCGADSVDMYCLESYDEMPCGPEDRGETERDGVTIHAGWGQTEIVAENGKCKAIKFVKCLSVRNEEGRFDPKFDESQEITADADVVLYCIGQKIQWKDMLKGTKAEFNRNGTVIVDPVTYETAEDGVFAGGDAVTGQKFVIDAIAAGKEGAISIHRYVRPHTTLTIGRDRRQFIELNKKDIKIDQDIFDNTSRQRPGYNEALRKTFSDDRTGFTEEQIKKETARCLGCGASIVDTNRCLGCGVCTTRCAFDAIHLYREKPDCSRMYTTEESKKLAIKNGIKQAVKIKFHKQ